MITNIFWVAAGIVFIAAGLASIFTHKVYLMSSAAKYTDESLKKYSLPHGIGNTVLGIGFIMEYAFPSTLFMIGSFEVKLGYVLMFVCCIASIFILGIAEKKILVKVKAD